MSLTKYSAQEAMNLRYQSPYNTQFSVQEIANRVDGSSYATQYSFQQVLNMNLTSSTHPTHYSEQEALWLTLQAELALTGSRTQYSVQELLNMAVNAALFVPAIIDDATPSTTGAATAAGYNGLLQALAYI